MLWWPTIQIILLLPGRKSESVFEISLHYAMTKTAMTMQMKLPVQTQGVDRKVLAQAVEPVPGCAARVGSWYFQLEKTALGSAIRELLQLFFSTQQCSWPQFTMIYGQTHASVMVRRRFKKVWYRKLLNDHWRDFESFNSPNNTGWCGMQMSAYDTLKH